MEYFKKKYKKKVRDYSDVHYPVIDVEAGECVYNYRCHLNAVHHAWKNKYPEVALVMYRQKGWLMPHVHFVNIVKDKYIDNTIGEWSRVTEYRLIRKVPEIEFADIGQLLQDTQNFFKAMATPIEKLFGALEDS